MGGQEPAEEQPAVLGLFRGLRGGALLAPPTPRMECRHGGAAEEVIRQGSPMSESSVATQLRILHRSFTRAPESGFVTQMASLERQ